MATFQDIYPIDTFSGFEISSVAGTCEITLVNVTDGDNRIWVEPKNYTIIMTCSHDLLADYGIRITPPAEFLLVDRARCVFGKYNTRYSCIVYADEGYLEAYSFSSTTISAETTIHFTIDSIRNPSVEGPTGSWTVQTLDTQGSQVDVGENWYFDDDYWGPGNITTFEVEALSEGVGAYPVKYRFHMVPVGEIC